MEQVVPLVKAPVPSPGTCQARPLAAGPAASDNRVLRRCQPPVRDWVHSGNIASPASWCMGQ